MNQILQWVEIRASGEELLFSETKRYICFDLDSLDTLTQPCPPLSHASQALILYHFSSFSKRKDIRYKADDLSSRGLEILWQIWFVNACQGLSRMTSEYNTLIFLSLGFVKNVMSKTCGFYFRWFLGKNKRLPFDSLDMMGDNVVVYLSESFDSQLLNKSGAGLVSCSMLSPGWFSAADS